MSPWKRPRVGFGLALAVGLVLGACTAGTPSSDGPVPAASEPTPGAAAPEVATASASPRQPAASASSEPSVVAGPPFVSLEVTGFEPAVLAVPVGARDPRPVFVATHGNFDRPEWQCEVWSQIVRGRAFVLCPRGAARRDSPGPDDVRFTYNDNKQLEREVDAALASLWSSPYATHLAPGPVVWAGFSLGAIMGVAIAARRPADFPVLVLIEGGVDRMTAQNVAALAKGGARAVMLACAQAGCAGSARGAQRRLEQAGLTVLVVDAGRVGHTYDGPVAKAVARELPALLAGDPRFLSVFAD